MFVLTAGAFAFGFGAVAAWRLPNDSLTMTVAMIITFLMVLITMGLAGGIVGWVAVSIIRAKAQSDGGAGGPQQPIYPPVMIFPGQNAPGGNYLPAGGNGSLETIPGPRTFTIIGDDDD
jgi:hypothetical protein